MVRGQFSIITAVRNRCATIADTLESVASQEYPKKEHIVQDGASTDGTLDVIEQVATDIVKLESTPDSGVYDAFNRGLRCAQGEFVAFLGADDVYEGNGVLADVADAFQDPSIDIVFGDALIVRPDDTSRIVRSYRSASFRGLNSLRYGFMPAHTATFVRRSLYERVGEFDTSYRIAGDFEWFVRAFRSQPPKFVYLRKPLVRMRAGGLSSFGPRATWTITREALRACLSNATSTSYTRLLLRLPVKALELIRH